MKKILFIAVIIIPFILSGHFNVTSEKQNVVSSRIVGLWHIDDSLTQRLQGVSRVRIKRVEFIKNNKIVEKIPAKYGNLLSNKLIYLSGIMKLNSKITFPFILISLKGNPHIVFFRPRYGHPLGDAESFNVFVARGKIKSQDILFIGGDFNNTPFTAYKRM